MRLETQPDAKGFSSRNVRRMRDFYLSYRSDTAAMSNAVQIGWTQNVVILEADLTIEEKTWYIRAVRRHGWSKLDLLEKIATRAHEQIVLDTEAETCYTGDIVEQLERITENAKKLRNCHGIRCTFLTQDQSSKSRTKTAGILTYFKV